MAKRFVKNGRVYEPAKAMPVLSDGVVTMYKKKTGEYFLYNARKARNSINPLTFDEAMAYAKSAKKSDWVYGETYNQHFGLLTDATFTVPIQIRIEASLDAKLRRAAAVKGVTPTEYVTDLLKDNLFYVGGDC